MHRIEGEDFISVGGKNLFQDGPPGTRVEDDWLNAVQEELASSIEDAGLTLKTAATDTRDQLKSAIPIITNRYAIVKDVQVAGTPGGSGGGVGTWLTRTLNTISTNITGASLSSNQITLPAGTYKISATAPFLAGAVAGQHKAKLYNITDASDEIIGSSVGGRDNQYPSLIRGVFTIATSKVFEIQHRSTLLYNWGSDSNFGVDEVYTQVEIIKIAD